MDPADSRPALMVLFGGHGRDVWPLEGGVVALGRAHGCDIQLNAPDVSGLHCVIWRSERGLELRDCGSRSGTQVNGESIGETCLHDGDMLQVGSFCFRLHVPPAWTRDAGQGVRLRRLERSRRHLAGLALQLRHRLRELQRPPGHDAARHLNRKASGLRHYMQILQQRIRQLEQAERELARDRDLFEEEKQVFREQARSAEANLARRD